MDIPCSTKSKDIRLKLLVSKSLSDLGYYLQELCISVFSIVCSMSQNWNIINKFFIIVVFTFEDEEVILYKIKPYQNLALIKLTEHLYPLVIS